MEEYYKEIRNLEFEDIKFENIIKNIRIFEFIKYLPLISLGIADFILIYIYEYFFNILQNHIWGILVYALGFILSFFVLRTDMFLEFNLKKQDKKEKLESKSQKINEKKKLSNNKKLPLMIWNYILIVIRFIFFNVLNDIFIATLFWTAYFGIFYSILCKFGIFHIPPEFIFVNFLGIITMISLMSGFFLLYIPRYKNNVKEIIQKNLNNFLISNMGKINPWDFLKFIKNDNEELKTYVDSILTSNINKKIEREIIDQTTRRKRKFVFKIINIQCLATKDPIEIFKNLEQIIEKEQPKLLVNFYTVLTDYFKNENKKFKKRIKKTDYNNIRKIIFSNIIFFDESLFSYINLKFKFSVAKTKSKTFEDLHADYLNKCIFDFNDYFINIALDD